MQARDFERAAQRPWWLAMLLAVFMALLSACSDSPAPAPVISVQPSDTSAVAGTAATLSVSASGPDITYQWQVSTDGGTTWTPIAGATQASYTTPPTTLADSGKRYRVVVSAAGISVNSSAVQLTVSAAVVAPTLTVQPAAQTATAPDPATFSVTAGGTAPSYQWQRSTDGGATFVAIAGATAASYSTGATTTAMNGDRYRVVVSNSAGSVTSGAVVLTVNPTPVAAAFTTQPANQSVTAGTAAAFTVVATGTPAPTLQWQRSTDGGATFANIAGATDPTFNTGLTTVSQNGERYRAVATNSAGSATSNAATLTVNPAPQAPVFTTQPTAQTVTAPAAATFTAAASGVPTPTLQWQLSTDGGTTFANINGATSGTYTTPATTQADSGKRYRVIATNSAGSTTSTAVGLGVLAPAAVTTLASTTHAGGVPDNVSGTPTLSSNGRRVAFISEGTNLVAGGAVGGGAYVRDLDTGTTVQVNRTVADAASSRRVDAFVKISGNGRYVVFSSDDSNLVAGDTNGGTDVFVRDLLLGSTVRMNLRADGAQVDPNGNGTAVDISADGRYVLFQSGSDLTGSGAPLANGYRWFLRDLQLATVIAITAFDGFNGAVLSGNGQHAAVLDVEAGLYRVRLFSVGLGVRTVLSIPAGDGFVGGRPALDHDGRFLAFVFRSASLLGGAAATANQIGIVDTQAINPATTLELVSRTAAGAPGDGGSSEPQLSADGRYVLFASRAPALTDGIGQPCCGPAVVVRDRSANTTRTASRGVNGAAVGPTGEVAAISSDGSTVAFAADRASVQGGGALGGTQVFVAPRP